MFNNIKKKLKYKLMNWLEVEQLQKDYKQYIKENDRDKFNFEHNIKYNYESIQHQSEQIDVLNRTLQSVVSLGADITREPYDRNRSWAVVCIEGKCNIVKFIDMQGQNYKYILDFLKQFECSRRVIDSPNKHIFEENFVWFNDDKK